MADVPGVAAETAEVEISLLGGFAVRVNGRPVVEGWRLRKAKTLVKLLALAEGHRLHRGVLAEWLWPGLDAAAAANNLHQALHVARRVLGMSAPGCRLLELRDDLVVLCPAGHLTVDVEVFEAAAARAIRSGDVAQLWAAVQLWSGGLLPEDRYADWVAAVRDRLDEQRARIAVALSAVCSGEEVLPVIEAIAAERPADELVHRALMTTLAASGQRWDALAVYEKLRDTLDRDLAAEPAAETRRLYWKLLDAGVADSTVAHNLPTAPTSFVGRRRELAELGPLLDRTRMLTLTGPGGAGKTRLAVELARRQAGTDRYSEGVWFVGLAGLRDGTLVVSAVAAELGLVLAAGRLAAEALVDQLAGRHVLLLLDNCEHLVSSCAELVAALLAGCPGLVVIATSREALRIPGEVSWRVSSLELPPPGPEATIDRSEAVQLFVERARDAVPGFALTATSAAPVARVCRQLDGIPLALELAAARLAHLSVTELADRLQDVLGVLGEVGRGRLDRQQTLAATLDWSHQLLTEQERVLFRRLAVFAGGFGLHAAEQVASEPETVEVLSRLIDKSLVAADTAESGARYRLLEIVRQYAAARLSASGELTECRRRHREWYAALTQEHDPDRSGPVAGEPSGWFDVEYDNLRAALSSALAEDPQQALLLASSLWRFWMSRGRIAEGASWLARSLDACPAPSDLRARALYGQAIMHVRRGEGGPLRGIAAEIEGLLCGEGDLPLARHQQATLVFLAGDWSDAAQFCADTVTAAARQPALRTSVLHLWAMIAMNRGDFDEALVRLDAADASLIEVPAGTMPFFTTIAIAWMVEQREDVPLVVGEETVLLGRRVGGAQAAGYLLAARATHARLSGQPQIAVNLLDRATETFNALGDDYGEAFALAQRGHALRGTGDLGEALNSFEKAETLRRSVRDLRGTALAVAGQALIYAARGHAERARSAGRSALSMMERSGDAAGVVLTMADLAVVEVLLGDVKAALPLVERAARTGLIPGGHRAAGWHHLMHARLLRGLGRTGEAGRAVAQARDIFTGLGELRGLRACASR
jgi:predicted ATPase/DNA-binding SARP family transcriptional activator